MNTQELMQPRWKVIADYPGNNKGVGSIVTLDSENPFDDSGFHERYPAIFQPLEWWEERQLADLPGYAHYISMAYESCVVKVTQWTPRDGKVMAHVENHPNIITTDGRSLLPATEADYNEYIKLKTSTP